MLCVQFWNFFSDGLANIHGLNVGVHLREYSLIFAVIFPGVFSVK